MSEQKKKTSIPPDAKRVFKGVIFEVWQWEQKLFDGSTATFEKLRRPDSAIVLPTTEDRKIILLHEEQAGRPPFISIPAGRVEAGETPEAAARRELLEETGYAATDLRQWFAIEPYNKIDWTVHFFVAQGVKKVQEPTPDPGERVEPFFVTFDEFLQVIHDPLFRDKEVALELLRIEENPKKMAELKTLFFGL